MKKALIHPSPASGRRGGRACVPLFPPPACGRGRARVFFFFFFFFFFGS